jgi:hypothetical protein
MRTSQALLIGVVFCLAVSSVYGTATEEIQSFIERSSQSAFGRTLIGTIELELSSAAPGDYLLKLLNKMSQTLNGDILIANKTHNDFQKKCSNDLALLKQETKTAAAIIVESKKVIESVSRQRGWAESEKDTKERERTEQKTNYKKIQDIRAAEAAEYQKKMTELSAAITVLTSGRTMLEQKFEQKAKSGAFVEVSNTFRAYVEKVKRSIGSGEYTGHGYVSVISFVAELIEKAAVQAKASSVQRILTALQQIIDQLEATKTFEANAEKDRINNFRTLDTLYTNSIQELDAHIASLTSNISKYSGMIRDARNRVKENTIRIRVKSREKRKTVRICQAEDKVFKAENKVR